MRVYAFSAVAGEFAISTIASTGVALEGNRTIIATAERRRV